MSTRAPVDVVLVGGGIMSATLATLISELEPNWSIEIIDRMPAVAMESSNAWNNAGTGHAALCELNYSPQRKDGSVDVSKAIDVGEQFQISRQFWASLVQKGVIADPASFITATPHLSFVQGAKDVQYLRTRYEALRNHPLFEGMKYSENPAEIAGWVPLVTKGRDRSIPIAATYSADGTDVNFGALTRQLVEALHAKGARVSFEQEVTRIRRKSGGWEITTKGVGRYRHTRRARFVFVGAGGGALRLLQSSRIPEIRGFAGFPVSGQFLKSSNPELIAQHHAKVYGKAAVGAPPMSVPHLDTRVVDGGTALLFGPYAGFTPKFQKHGSAFDLLASVRLGNLIPLISVGFKTLFNGLLGYLVGQVFSSSRDRLEALREYFPGAAADDWELITAGQRVQVVKRGPGGGVLQFGTEVVAAADGSIAGLLGASPGASTSVDIMLTVLERCFPAKIADWKPALQELIPSYGSRLSADPDRAAATLDETAAVLRLKRPA